jgi:hypothetical protein
MLGSAVRKANAELMDRENIGFPSCNLRWRVPSGPFQESISANSPEAARKFEVSTQKLLIIKTVWRRERDSKSPLELNNNAQITHF